MRGMFATFVAFILGLVVASIAMVQDFAVLQSLSGNIAGGFLATLVLGRSMLHEIDDLREWARAFGVFSGYTVAPPDARSHPVLDRFRRKSAAASATTIHPE